MFAATSSEATSSVFNITNENNSFSITIPSHWNSKSVEKAFDELFKLIELRSENDFEIHFEQVRNTGITLINDCSLSGLGTFKNEILEELKK